MDAGPNKRILLIEDELHIAEGLRLNLNLQGYAVRIAEDGWSGLRLWEDWLPDLIVLDIMLPGMDGLSVLRTIRLADKHLPVLILSAKGTPSDRVKGLACEADDYLAKPFDLEEFLLRVDRLLARVHHGEGESEPAAYCFGDNQVDFQTGQAFCQAGRIQLTDQELKLLKIFVTHPGKPLSRTALLEMGWGYSQDISTRTVDNFIVRLRRYFEKNPKVPLHFKSLRSVGYVFHPDPAFF